MDIGIANPTNKAFLNPRKNINTKTTKITPKIILLTRSFTWFSVILDWSLEIDKFKSLGNRFSLISLIKFWIFFDASIKFFPPRFLTWSKTTFSPKDLAYDVRSFSLKVIVAKSPI